MTNLFFETHATSTDNEKGIASGHFDPPLSKKGREQSRDLGLRYKNNDISVVYCSDLRRSFETAEIAFRTKDIFIVKDCRLREWNFGKYNGYPASEVEEMKLSLVRKPFPGGESLLDAVKRISDFIQILPLRPIINHKGNISILIIGHRAVYYTLEYLYNKVSLENLVSDRWHWQPGWMYTQTS